jgi:hypothetical protein
METISAIDGGASFLPKTSFRIADRLQQRIRGVQEQFPGSSGRYRGGAPFGLAVDLPRHYRPKDGVGKSADAQRQAFTRAMKANLEEGTVKQESWDRTDWLWQKGK